MHATLFEYFCYIVVIWGLWHHTVISFPDINIASILCDYYFVADFPNLEFPYKSCVDKEVASAIGRPEVKHIKNWQK